ncbi:MAG: aquaporin [Terracidiphilus sp.]
MHSVWFGEFMGTLVLLLLGGGVNAGVTLRKSYAADTGWLALTTGWGLAVLCGVLVAQAFGSPAANINPAITLAGRMGDIIDFDAGGILSGEATIAGCAEKLLQLSLAVASGERFTKAELLGQNDFIPWKRGVSL